MSERNAMIKHVHMDVPWLLSMDDTKLMETVTHPDGATGARAELQSMVDAGEVCFVMDSTCDNRNPNGSCAGHPVEEPQDADEGQAMVIHRIRPLTEVFCIGCGCSDSKACVTDNGPCHWLKLDRKNGRGVCSNCSRRLNEWEGDS
ncbi:TPA: hypothetical protein L3N15_004168 [Vibrio parahaemolyticus]|nr:hypothetical protein [Vibrio parahaemolyticus]